MNMETGMQIGNKLILFVESRFNLWYYYGRIRIKHYAKDSYIPECTIERHSGRTPDGLVRDAIAHHTRSQLLRGIGNLGSNLYIN